MKNAFEKINRFRDSYFVKSWKCDIRAIKINIRLAIISIQSIK